MSHRFTNKVYINRKHVLSSCEFCGEVSSTNGREPCRGDLLHSFADTVLKDGMFQCTACYYCKSLCGSTKGRMVCEKPPCKDIPEIMLDTFPNVSLKDDEPINTTHNFSHRAYTLDKRLKHVSCVHCGEIQGTELGNAPCANTQHKYTHTVIHSNNSFRYTYCVHCCERARTEEGRTMCFSATLKFPVVEPVLGPIPVAVSKSDWMFHFCDATAKRVPPSRFLGMTRAQIADEKERIRQEAPLLGKVSRETDPVCVDCCVC